MEEMDMDKNGQVFIFSIFVSGVLIRDVRGRAGIKICGRGKKRINQLIQKFYKRALPSPEAVR